MDKQNILSSVKKLREISKKRSFTQSLDLIVNLRKINLKNPDEKVDAFFQLPKEKPKKPRVCALVDKELATKAKIFDTVVLKDDFQKYSKNKKLIKQLVAKHDYFLAQANLMGEIATSFGKVLGPKGKMPNPKAGQIVPPVIPSLDPIKKKLNSMVRLVAKDQLVVKSSIGSEDMSDEDLAENINYVFSHLVPTLPKEKENVRSVYIKFTMSPSVEVTDKGPVIHERKKSTKKAEVVKV